MSTGLGVGLTVVLLLLNAFFVGAEFALISARRTRLEPKVEAGSRIARVTLGAMENVSLMMAGAQLGITICSLALGAISEPAIAHLLEVPLNGLRVSDGWVHPIAFVVALALVTYLHVVIGEMVPKNLALFAPERVAMVLAPALVLIVKVLYPVLWVLNGIANGVLRLLKVEPKDEVASTFTRDEVSDLVGESRHGGLLDAEDERLLRGALEFEDRDVRRVLLPASTVRTFPPDVTPAQAESLSAQSFSRFPVADRPDARPRGYVHIKDLLESDAQRRERPLDPEVVRPLPTVPVTASLREALGTMQRERSHLAAVVDGPADDPGAPYLGIVALEDVLEELVGTIRDDSRTARRP